MKRNIYITVPCMSNGGAERVLYLIASGLREDFTIKFVFMNHDISKFDLSGFERINIYNLSLIGKIKYFASLMKKEKDSIFISFYDEIGMILTFAKGLKKNGVILSIRNDPRKFRKNMIPFRNILFRNCSHIVFQTEDAKKYFSKKIQKKGSIILNPVKFENQVDYIDREKRQKKFIAFSRFNTQKNIPMMLDAFELFSKKHQEYELDIYGSKGNDYDNVVEILKRKNMAKVNLKGLDMDIKNKIHKYTAFLSSSNFEGISNSMLESLSAGVPVICTDCPIGGTKMFVKNGINGYMVPVNDCFAMSEAMDKLIENESIYKTTFDEIKSLREKIDENIILEKWRQLISKF